MSRIYNSLPESIVDKGIVFKPVIGRNNKDVIRECKENKVRYKTVKVMSRNLKGKTDLYRQPYKPNEYIFVQQK